VIGSELLPMSTIEQRLPGCVAKYAALENFTNGRPWAACRHVVDGIAGMVCVEHPAAGVNCTQCSPHHLRRHSDKIEFGCDECRTVVEEIHGLIVEADSARLMVQDTRGRRRQMLGRLWLIGAGVCPKCWESESTAP
jgi:hypothetical protein